MPRKVLSVTFLFAIQFLKVQEAYLPLYFTKKTAHNNLIMFFFTLDLSVRLSYAQKWEEQAVQCVLLIFIKQPQAFLRTKEYKRIPHVLRK